LNESRSCNNLGTAWSEGKHGAASVDHGKARAFYDRACKLDNGLGCFNLGNVYRLGEGVKVDLKLAFDSFKKSCDLDQAKGCTELAILYYEGKAVKKDVKKTVSLLEKGCRLGSQPACKNLDILNSAEP
jgi:TPR repeat protein